MTDNKPKYYTECPKCGSDNLNTGRWESDSDWVSRNVECIECGFKWVEVFTFFYNEDVEGNLLNDDGDVTP